MNLTLRLVPVAEIPEAWKDGRPLLAFQRPEDAREAPKKAKSEIGFDAGSEADERWRVVWWRHDPRWPRGEWEYACEKGDRHEGESDFVRTVEPDFLAELPEIVRPGESQ